MIEQQQEEGKKATANFGLARASIVGAPPTQLLAAIAAVMQDVGFVHKGGENEFHGYKYATESDTIAALRPALLKHRLVVLPTMDDVATVDDNGNTHIVMHYRLFHVPSGEQLSIRIPASGNDRSRSGAVGDKGVYKAMTGAMKYMLRQTFMLETGDDPERGSEHDKSEPQPDVGRLLKIADYLLAHCAAANTTTSLNELWRANAMGIDSLRHEHQELFVRVRDAFSARKKQLTQGESEHGEQAPT